MPNQWAITEVTSYKAVVYSTTKIQVEIFDILAKAFNRLAAFVQHTLMCSLAVCK